MSKYRTAKRLQDAEFANEQYIKRELTHYYDHDGSLVIKARIPAEQGALIVKALEMAMDKEFSSDVTAVTSRRIACDSSIVTIKEDQNGEPLSIGRRSRTIPPPMRRALRARDKGCRFPGCTNTRFVDGHHIKHWATSGSNHLALTRSGTSHLAVGNTRVSVVNPRVCLRSYAEGTEFFCYVVLSARDRIGRVEIHFGKDLGTEDFIAVL